MSDDVKRVKDNWVLGLMQKGLIIQLSVKRWRASAKLKAADLGLKFIDCEGVDFSKRYLSLGKQLLLPPEVLKEFVTIEARSRALLKSMSFDTPWGRFVPDTALEEWDRQNKLIHDDYMEAARVFGDKYDEIVDMVRDDYRLFARDVWARLYPQNKNGATDSFIEHFVQKVVEKIPPRGEVVSSFSYNYICFEIPMPSFVQSDVNKANELKRKDDLAEDDLQAKKDIRRKLASVYVEKQSQLLDTFLESTVEEIRGQVATICVNVLESMGKTQKKNKEVTITQKNKITDMIKKVKHLNFYDDKAIDALVKDLDNEVNKVKGASNAELITDRLNKIVEVSTADLDPADFNPAVDYLEI